ncbi:MAG TPA: hypothetical protein VM681_00290 [Candidatus Thermoplasmatota archaeon]|nr:hypothetical protein [Candidatus Thermoplasmatota archaeon]
MATLLVELEVPEFLLERWDPDRVRRVVENAVARAYAHDLRGKVDARPVARFRPSLGEERLPERGDARVLARA